MPFDLGDTVPLTVEVRDSLGVLANAGAVTLTVTKPDGTNDSPSPTNPSTGIYRSDYAAATAGRYLVRWVATGANASAHTDAFDVRESVPPLLFSLSDAKAVLNISTTTSDSKIRDLIESTTAAVEFIVGAIVRRTVAERYDCNGQFSYLVARTVPVLSLTSIAPIINGGIIYAVGDFDVEAETGIMQHKNGRVLVGPLRLTYVVGRTIVPAAIRDAGRDILKHLWSVQTGPHGLPRLNEPVDGGSTMVLGLGYALPNRALQLLQPYQRAGKFA